MDQLDEALSVAGIKQAEDLLTNFEHTNNFKIHDVDIQIPDDPKKTAWSVTINGVAGKALAVEKPESGWLDLQSEGKAWCAAHPGEEIQINIFANTQLFLSGSFITKEIVDWMGSPGWTFLVDNSMLFIHVINVLNKGLCIGAVHLSTGVFV